MLTNNTVFIEMDKLTEMNLTRNTHFGMTSMSPEPLSWTIKSHDQLRNVSSHDDLNFWLQNQVPKNVRRQSRDRSLIKKYDSKLIALAIKQEVLMSSLNKMIKAKSVKEVYIFPKINQPFEIMLLPKQNHF